MSRAREPRPNLGAGLTREEEQELGRLIRGDDPAEATAARNKLIESNMALCVHVAKPYRDRGLDMDDLVGEAHLGLVEAANNWEPDRGVRFVTLAYRYALNQIRDAFTNRAHLIRIPSATNTIRARRNRADRLGRTPEIGPEMQDRLRLADRANRTSRESDFDAYAMDGFSMDSIADDRTTDDVDETIDREEAFTMLYSYLDHLDDRTRAVVTMRYGLDGGEPMFLREIGARIGTTREWSRKIEMKGIRQLRADYGVAEA